MYTIYIRESLQVEVKLFIISNVCQIPRVRNMWRIIRINYMYLCMYIQQKGKVWVKKKITAEHSFHYFEHIL